MQDTASKCSSVRIASARTTGVCAGDVRDRLWRTSLRVCAWRSLPSAPQRPCASSAGTMATASSPTGSTGDTAAMSPVTASNVRALGGRPTARSVCFTNFKSSTKDSTESIASIEAAASAEDAKRNGGGTLTTCASRWSGLPQEAKPAETWRGLVRMPPWMIAT